MEEAIKKFNLQFNFKPEIENSEKLRENYKHMIVCGMGGSHLSTGFLKMYHPGIEIYVHRDYGLPPYSEDFLKDSLLIASSYSGNTEEVVDFLKEGYSKGLDVAIVATGGELISFAKENELPYIEMPKSGIQPRSALIYSLLSIAKYIDNDQLMEDIYALKNKIDPMSYKMAGRDLANNLRGKIPIIYSSLSNLPIAYNWKIKFNETGKTPAFYNIFSELNHNEIAGFDTVNQDIKSVFGVIILNDKEEDHPQIKKRMKVTEELYEERGISVTSLSLEGGDVFEKIFRSLILADWTAYFMAQDQGLEPEAVEIIESLKKRIV